MNKIIQGDSLEVLKRATENSIDTIITDPPYGLSFMGKKWDYDVPSVEFWKEALRVLKPGGTLLCFAGSRTQHRMACNVEDAGFILKDTIMWLYGSGFPKATDIAKQLDKKNGVEHPKNEPISDNSSMSGANYTRNKMDVKSEEAKLWNGWKSHGLKPTYEPILVAQKPNDGTYANNALKWGVSGLNIDGGRIGTEEITTHGYKGDSFSQSYKEKGTKPELNEYKTTIGRFPANIILDEEVAKGEEWKRYFYCAKASKSERNAGCEGLPLGEPPASARSKPADGRQNALGEPRTNNHPTVKPLKLMEYLCILTKTPTGGVVLDPFAGSGTTGLACKNTGRNYILIEREPEYIEIIKARLK